RAGEQVEQPDIGLAVAVEVAGAAVRAARRQPGRRWAKPGAGAQPYGERCAVRRRTGVAQEVGLAVAVEVAGAAAPVLAPQRDVGERPRDPGAGDAAPSRERHRDVETQRVTRQPRARVVQPAVAVVPDVAA